MNGPDALTGERRSGRAALPGPGNGTGPAAGGEPPGQAPGAHPAAQPRRQARSGRRPRANRQASADAAAQLRQHPAALAGRPARFSLSNWPVSVRLVAVFAVASVMGLVFGGLRVAGAVSTANAYSRTAALAALGQQAIGLAQALEEERDRYAGVAAYSVLTSGVPDGTRASVTSALNAASKSANAQLTAAEQATDAAATRTQALAAAIGPAFPATVQAKASAVITMIGSIPGLRTQLAGQTAAQVVTNYSSSVADLFTLNDEITSGTSDAVLSEQVRALGALSRAKDEASQQRAFLYDALLELSVNNAGQGTAHAANNVSLVNALADAGGLGTLTTAQGLQFADLTDFNDAATTDESNAYQLTVAGAQAQTAQLIEGFVNLGGDPRPTFEQLFKDQTTLALPRTAVAATWYADQSAVISEMGQIESQVMDGIVARSQAQERNAVNSAVLIGGITAAAVLLVLLATALVGRTLVNPLRRLQADALEIATVTLPARVAAAAIGDEAVDGHAVEPVGVKSTDEIGQVARAFDQVHAEAVRLAGNEAQLRGSLSAMFISLSRRSVPLIDRLARMIDSMEQNEDDPDQLGNLFSMDHLVTRMRRNSENLLVLAGEDPVRKWTDAVPLADVTRAAAAEIEQYGRVALADQPGVMVSGQAAADVVHLLAELIENATLFSPQQTQVRVSVQELSSGGVLVEIRDDGVGVPPVRLADMNWRLDHPPALDVSISRHMGLYAVAHLAARHGIRVKLRPGTPRGLSALVWLPSALARQGRGAGPGDPDRAMATAAGTGANASQAAMAGAATTAGPGTTASFGSGTAFGTVTAAGAAAPSGSSRPPGPARLPAASRRPAPARTQAGRHRGEQQPARDEQTATAGTGGAPRPSTVWFSAKRPSAGPAPAAADSAAAWQPAGAGAGTPGGTGMSGGTGLSGGGGAAESGPSSGSGWGPGMSTPFSAVPGRHEAGGLAGPGQAGDNGSAGSERTNTGLPRRVPRGGGFPASDLPVAGGLSRAGSGTGPVPTASLSGAFAQAPTEAPGAAQPAQPAGGPAGPPPTPYPDQRRLRTHADPLLPTRQAGRAPSVRRSPEAVRDRLTGFQLGSRDAAQAGPGPRPAPRAGEENSR